MTEPQTIFLCSLTHNGSLDYRMADRFMTRASDKHNVIRIVEQNSLLAHACNKMYVQALNLREKHKLKWFAMLHADVVPEPFWLDKMVQIAEEADADMLSAIVPIKDGRGLTSTAIAQQGTKWGAFARLTMAQVHALPKTFDKHLLRTGLKALPDDLRIELGEHHELLLNTGCMISRLDQPWSGEVFFNITDRINLKFGQYYAEVEPEDWCFSRMIAEAGGRVMATSAINLQHIGNSGFNTVNVWGEKIDPEALRFLYAD